MPEIQYPKNPNSDTAFVVQEDGTKNRALMTAPQDTSTLELPSNANSTKGYVTIDGKKQRVILTADIGGGSGGSVSSVNGQTGDVVLDALDVGAVAKTGDTMSGVLNINVEPSSQYHYASVLVLKATYNGSGEPVTIGVNPSGYLYIDNPVQLGANLVPNGTGKRLGSSIYPWSVVYTTAISNGADIAVPTTGGTMAVIGVNTTATLAVADWSSNTQTVSVSGVKADSVVFVSPAPASASDYASAGILCTAQAANSLTFTCTTTPTNAITVNVVCM